MPGRAVDLLDRAKPHAFKAPKEPSCGRVQSFIQQNTRHVLVALVLLILLLASLALSLPRWLAAPDYVLIIDAGSTGTRIIAICWQDRAGRLPRLTPVNNHAASHKVPRRAAGDVRAYERVETEPGLDKFVGNAQGLQTHALGPLLDWAAAVVPARQHSRTPIFLLGTAGLRRLPYEQQQELLVTAGDVLAASPFRFKPGWARTITGADEGVHGWIALNYVTGHLAPHPLTAPKSTGTASASQSAHSSSGMAVTAAIAGTAPLQAADLGLATVGALDLGGSSLEVTFALKAGESSQATVNLTVMGVQYALFSQMHHGFGLNDAFDRSVGILQRRQQPTANASDTMLDHQDITPPHSTVSTSLETLPRNQADQHEQLSLTNTPTDFHAGLVPGPALSNSTVGGAVPTRSGRSTMLLGRHGERRPNRRLAEATAAALEHPCLNVGYVRTYTRAGQAPPRNVTLTGRPDWEACRDLAGAVVGQPQALCLQPPCGLGSPQPNSSDPFYALTGFYVVYHFLGLPSTASLAQLQQGGEDLCSTQWAHIAATRGQEIHVEQYCFRVHYITQLLREGLHLEEPQVHIGRGNEGWTLGAALAENSKLRDREGAGQTSGMQDSRLAVTLLWAVVALLVGALAGVLVYSYGHKVGCLRRRWEGSDSGPLAPKDLAKAVLMGRPPSRQELSASHAGQSVFSSAASNIKAATSALTQPFSPVSPRPMSIYKNLQHPGSRHPSGARKRQASTENLSSLPYLEQEIQA